MSDNTLPDGNSIAREIAQIPEVAERQINNMLPHYLDVGRRLAKQKNNIVMTCARGTSDCAALYFQYLAGICLGVPVTSMPPSLASVYRAPLAAQNGVMLSISQSGASTDLHELQNAAKHGGALTVALTNNEHSRLAAAADITLPLCAGREESIAATKSFTASLLAVAAIIAAWGDHKKMIDAIRQLPDRLVVALKSQWCAATATSWYVISRGVMLVAATEGALKLKEICRTHAEAMSAAELRHGPITLAGSGMGVFVFGSRDATAGGIHDAAEDLRRTSTPVIYVGVGDNTDFPITTTASPLLDPISAITSFYVFAENRARKNGIDMETPPLLQKVTDTR